MTKHKRRRETFPCRNCITYVICLEKSKIEPVWQCPILSDWWKKLERNFSDADQRMYIYDKYFHQEGIKNEKR